MASPEYNPASPPPRTNRPQHWANLILGVWLFLSPWVLRFANTDTGAPDGKASWNAWVVGVIVAIAALSTLARADFRQEWVNAILGIWTFIAPWALGFAGLPRANWDHWIVGALIFLVAASSLAQERRRPSIDLAHAGDRPRRRD
jgi:hypothetical protein